MNILDLVAQYLESIGFIYGPYNPGCFFYDTRQGEKIKICLLRGDGRMIDIIRTKEPTVVLVYRGWMDDLKSSLVDLNNPKSLEEINSIIYE
jgi:hypothetical protein